MGIILNNLSKTNKLGEILIEAGLLNPSQLESALIEGKKKNLRLGAALVALGVTSEDKILDALSLQLNIKKIDLSKIIVDSSVSKILPEGLARQFKMVPVGITGDILTLALSDPLNVFATDALKRHTPQDVKIEIVLAKEQDILRSLDFAYSAKDISKASTGQTILTKDSFVGTGAGNQFALNASASQGQAAQPPNFMSGNAPFVSKDAAESEDINIIKLVNDIIFHAAKSRVSDIHIEPLKDEIIVRNRIDGELFEFKRIPIQFLNPVIARIKIMSNMDIAEKRNPQDSRFEIEIAEKSLDIRVSIIPTINGEKAVLRVLDKSSKIFKVSEMPIDNADKDKILKVIYKKYGLFLITGPTGSGKTTTAYSVLTELNGMNKNLITVEDPVEYKIKYINQIEANLKGGVSFAGALRAVLRQDPDIILVGEIRDEETARIAMQAALTGHFVISTLHTQDASNTISRLVDMGIEPFLISSSIAGIIGQRLIKKLCSACKKPYTPEDAVIKDLGLPPGVKFTFYKENEDGCDLCANTGFHGRISIMELLYPSRNIQKLIIEKADSGQIRSAAIKEGFIPLRMAGIKKVIEGTTSLEEVLQATQDV